MKRIVKDPMVRRNEILDVAERLVSTKGYEQMAIQDIMDELQIAKGTVYHYFDSKAALLEALVERMGEQIEQLVLPIVQDPNLAALDKLLRYFAAIDQWKLAHQRLVLDVHAHSGMPTRMPSFTANSTEPASNVSHPGSRRSSSRELQKASSRPPILIRRRE